MISNLIEFKYAMCYNQRKGNNQDSKSRFKI
jgi:hypothetical protein